MKSKTPVRAICTLCIVSVVPMALEAQARRPGIPGTWEAETPDGPQVVIVRADSSASFGDETVRWRLAADTIQILFGDEWVGYNFILKAKTLTLSGGDLEEPITLERIGPATPRPAGVPLPPVPKPNPGRTREMPPRPGGLAHHQLR